MTNPDESVLTLLQRYKWQLFCMAAVTICFNLYHTLHTPSPQPKAVIKSQRRTSLNLLQRSQSMYEIPLKVSNATNTLLEEIQHLNDPTCKIEKVAHLVKQLKLRTIPLIVSPLREKLQDEAFTFRGSYVLSKNNYGKAEELVNPTMWLLAGPRKHIYYEPSKVRAAIVTCGGLCPGLNVVIREIYIALTEVYGVEQVFGIHFGLKGIYTQKNNVKQQSGETKQQQADYYTKLDQRSIREIQYKGGTVLGSSRGGFDVDKIYNALVEKGINQLYIIGGDGSHRAILAISQRINSEGTQISIMGIPKTIDNDIPFIDKSFGFETAVSESIRAIRSAFIESRGVEYGIGLVRLMGRDAGFIAMEATNASRDVDVCLVPEFPFDLQGQFGVLEYIYQQLLDRKHLVVVVAEGAGVAARDLVRSGEEIKKDQSGNVIHPDIGQILKTAIVDYCKKCTLKYIDPTYMIRTVAANPYDRKLCSQLAYCTVHGAMAGYTAFTVGHINQHVAMIPVSSLKSSSKIMSDNRAWQRLLTYTSQPTFLNP